jgi:hypothetical protein
VAVRRAPDPNEGVARRRGPKPRRRARPNADPIFAFLNIPFDPQFESLYLAFIAGLSGFGLIPQTVLQIPGSQRRLDRLIELLGTCQYSFHDLSRVELDAHRPRTPRFNMPFELGLAVAQTEHVRNGHTWYVFEARRFRVLKSLSDINGTEVYIHGGGPVGVLRELTNALARSRHRPTVGDLRAVYQDLKRTAAELKRELATHTLFDTRPFLDLVLAASISASRRIASLR